MFLDERKHAEGGAPKKETSPHTTPISGESEAHQLFDVGDYGGDFLGFSESGGSNAENARRRIAEKQARASQEGLVTKHGISKWRGVIAKLGINLPRFSLKGIIGSIKNNFRL